MHRTRIKVCGITRLEDALAAADAGADAVGFVFAPGAPDVVSPAEAWRILGQLPPFVATVGVFVNASLREYGDIEETCPTDYGQLHGDESEKVARACGPRVIKTVRFDAARIAEDLAKWGAVQEVDAVLIEAPAGDAAFNWSAVADACADFGKPLILSGGLTPAIVGDAIRAVRPYGVNVSSEVESTPGRKDSTLIRDFCEAVQRADASR